MWVSTDCTGAVPARVADPDRPPMGGHDPPRDQAGTLAALDKSKIPNLKDVPAKFIDPSGRGVYVSGFGFPVVPRGQARLRLHAYGRLRQGALGRPRLPCLVPVVVVGAFGEHDAPAAVRPEVDAG